MSDEGGLLPEVKPRPSATTLRARPAVMLRVPGAPRFRRPPGHGFATVTSRPLRHPNGRSYRLRTDNDVVIWLTGECMLVLGANLALDRTLRIARLVPGHVQRPESAVATAGGKSVNVLRAAAPRGGRGPLAALPPRPGGRLPAHLLQEGGDDGAARPTAGEAPAA